MEATVRLAVVEKGIFGYGKIQLYERTTIDYNFKHRIRTNTITN